MPEKPIRYWNKQAETLPRPKLEALQLRRLRQTVGRVYRTVPFYREALDRRGLTPAKIRSLADLRRIPFTTKTDLREHYPLELLAVPRDDVVRVHCSSGTTGKPTVTAYSAEDLDMWAEVMARVYTMAGCTRRDVIHNALGYGLFTGGLGFHLGAERIGAMAVPCSGGMSKRQIMLMEDFEATVLAATPSYALVLAETAREMGVDFRERMRLRVGLLGAEPWTEEMRRELQVRMNIEAYDSYGLTEIVGPGVALECPYHDGLHIWEDHFLPEVVDPDSGAPLEDGAEGELVITTITRRAMPLLRYRTRDRVALRRERCRCGRTMARMGKVQGRTDDMLIVRGVNVFPSQIEEVVLAESGVEPHYQILVDRPKNKLDTLEVWVEAAPALWGLGPEAVQRAEQQIAGKIHDSLGLSTAVRVAAPNAIRRSEGKARRVVDKRDLNA
ncbi:MAG: phenylacetate--CoA ligase [Anaerolineales bacterium]|nr:phenylacetate--CoA ligase [Anaerolineales bacterium]